MPTAMKYQITLSTPVGALFVRRFNNPQWMITALNAHPEWTPVGGRYSYAGVERTLRNEYVVRDVVIASDGDRAARAAERKAAKAWRDAHPEGLPPGDERHGVNGYTNYDCRCMICTDAHALTYGIRRDRDRTLEPGDPRHGTDNGYHYHHCKCEKCLAAHAKAHPKPLGRGPASKPYEDWEIKLLSTSLDATLAELAEQTGRTVSAVQKKRAQIRAERLDMQPA